MAAIAHPVLSQDAAPEAPAQPPATPAAPQATPDAPVVEGEDAAAQDPANPAQGLPEEAVIPEPAASLIVRDLVILQADHYGTTYNDPEDFTSTLFNRSPRRRKVNPNAVAVPMPLGLITLEGEADQPVALRVEVAAEDGRFLGHWPHGVAAQDYLVWYDIKPVATPAGRMLIPHEHWLAPMRDEDSRVCFNTRGHVDRFFAYDATFAFTPKLAIDGDAEAGYTIAGDTLPQQSLVMLVRRSGEGWLVASLDSDAAATTQSLDMQPAAGPDAALAPIFALLEAKGYSPSEIDTAAAILRESAFGDASMSLLYVLGREELDAMLPIHINIDDAEVRRVGIVVVNNVEPDISGTVGGLITQLGSEDWPTRDAAQRALIEMDRAAITLVRENASHDDPEIAYRIEQVIAAYEQRHGD